MKYDILRLLKEAAPGYLSGGEIGRRFNVSRTAVWKYIEELRQEGYNIEASSRKGYRLLRSGEMLNSYEIANDLGTSLVGREVRYYDTLDSSNNLAKKLASEGCADGMTVVAGHQSAGRGRMGRNWESPAGKGIYVSVVLKPPIAPAETQVLTLAAAVAVANAIFGATGIRAGIKWPNDVVIDGRKACGILTEMSSEAERVNYIIIGIGINYSQNAGDFPEEIRDKAISLAMAVEERKIAGGMQAGRLSVIRSVLRELDSALQLVLNGRQDEVLEKWREYSVTLGREVCFVINNTEYTGTAEDITPEGKLVVRCRDGVRRELYSGEVSVRGIYGYA